MHVPDNPVATKIEVTQSLKIIFAGTPDFAAQHLAALLTSEHHVIGVFTQPDRPAGRGNKLTSSPVKRLAQDHNIPVFQPSSLNHPAEQQQIFALNADLMVVVAYGLILPKAVLAMPALGCINVHGSLLPRWRGAAPIQRALWAGDSEIGITIMQMDEGLDSGDMLYKLACPIEPSDTSTTLYSKLAQLGSAGMLITIKQLANDTVQPKPQDGNAVCYAKKLSKQEARLDWSLAAVQLERCIRAFNPWPISYFFMEDQQIKVWCAQALPHHNSSQPGEILCADKAGIQIATANGVLNVTELQLPGKKAMKVQDILNAHRTWFTPGKRLT